MAIPAPARGARGAARVRSRDALRENFMAMLRRSYQRAEQQRKGSGLQVYQSSAALMHGLCAQKWAQQTIFPAELGLARRFLVQTRIPVRAARNAAAMALMANAWAPAWTDALLQMDQRSFESLLAVTGRKHLDAALASGRGTLLVHSHTLYTQLIWRWLEHQSIDQGMTLWQWTWTRKRNEIDDPKVRALEGARELHGATQSLRKGGLVHVLADGGRVGGKQVELPFLNRRRAFQPTFADLAIGTRANLVTADIVMTPRGDFLLEFGEPFAAYGEDKDRNAALNAIVRAYAQHLARRWTRHWANLPWRQMQRYLKFPPLSKART